MFTTKVSADSKSELLNKSRLERERRELLKQHASSAIVIQKHFRRYLSNKRFTEQIVGEMEGLSNTCTATQMLHVFNRVLYVSRGRVMASRDQSTRLTSRDKLSSSGGHVLCAMVQKVLSSMDCTSKDRWYVSLAVSKSCKDWLSQVLDIIACSLEDLKHDVDIISGTGTSCI